MDGWMGASIYVFMHACMPAWMYASLQGMYVCMYVCAYVCMFAVFMYACLFVHKHDIAHACVRTQNIVPTHTHRP